MTQTLATITYAIVVSRETDRIALMIAALNDLEVKLGDILIAYVQAPITENVWTTLSYMFIKDARNTAVIVRALFGLKSAQAAFGSHLVKCMESLWYESCNVNLDYGLNQKSD